MGDKRNIPEDSGDVLSKTLSGNYNYDELDAVQAARMVTGFVPGTQLLDPALAAGEGMFQSQKRRKYLEDVIGEDLDRASQRSPLLKRVGKKINSLWEDRVGEALVSLIGGGVGMWAGAMLLAPVIAFLPFAPVIAGITGAIAGTYLTNQVYNAVFPPKVEDPTKPITQIFKAQQQGQAVPPELVFAALAAHLPRHVRKRIDKTIAQHSGLANLTEAAEQGRWEAITPLMRSYDIDIRAITGMEYDKNPGKSAVAQYAEWINSGALDARGLLYVNELPRSSLHLQAQHAPVMAPQTPGRGPGHSGKSPA